VSLKLTEADSKELTALREKKKLTADESKKLQTLERKHEVAKLTEERQTLREKEAAGEKVTTEDGERKTANKVTERIGEVAADEYMATESPKAKKVVDGTGPGTLDQVWHDEGGDPEYIIIEAKGGSATNTSARGEAPDRAQQGSRAYLEDVVPAHIAKLQRQLDELEAKRSLDPKNGLSEADQAAFDAATQEQTSLRGLQKAMTDGRVAYREVTQKLDGDGVGDVQVREYDIDEKKEGAAAK
jgi:hypothetical protein